MSVAIYANYKKGNDEMSKNQERRKSARIDQTSALKVEDLKSGKIYKARMFNYSQNGFYFESDSILNPGEQIYIGIQDSPYAPIADVLEYYRAEIVWRKKLKDSYFYHGYGVKFKPVGDKQDLNTDDSKRSTDLRKHPRKPFTRTILFSAHNGTNKGSTKNISPSGVFITAEETFNVGQTLNLVLPLKSGKEAKIKGQIVWTNDEGFGVKFLNRVDK